MDLSALSDDTLLGKIEALSETERFSLIDLLIHVGELDTRDACQKRGYASVFAYLTRRLGYAESDAIRRVRTARAARKYPSILRMLANGELHLVSAALLAPLLTSENHERLLRQASRRSTREVERMVAELSPAAALPRDRIRALPAPTPAVLSPDPSAMPLLMPTPTDQGAAPDQDLAPAERSAVPAAQAAAPAAQVPPPAAARRVLFTFSAGEEMQNWFEQARDLLRHRFPMGRMEEIIGEALRRLVQDELPAASERRPRASLPETRSIPRWVQDTVWRRDAGRCAYISPEGVRCGETAWLEYDHIHPFAKGGPSNDPGNIRLLCRAHNQSEARRVFGQSP